MGKQSDSRNMTSAAPSLFSAPFYGILDTGYVPADLWEKKFLDLAAGGARLIQVRAKKESLSQVRRLLERAIAARQTLPEAKRPAIILNDHLEIALQYEGIGLHVGQDDIPARDARQELGPDRILGLSTHSPDQAQKAMDLGPNVLDYFAVGPVFATQTKPDYHPVGLRLVEWVAAQNPKLPFYCIGGINRQNAHLVSAAGARSVVTVSDVLLAESTSDAVRETIAALNPSQTSAR